MTRVSVLHEGHALDCFWQAIRGHADKLHMLREMARVEVLRPDEWDRLAIREQSADVTSMLFASDCFCCGGSSARLAWHHVIQVQHGGSNSPGNLVALCVGCHGEVHPWLVPQPNASRVRGWSTPSDLMKTMWPRLERIFNHEQAS